MGLIAGMGSVAWVATFTNVAFLWQNVVGALAVVIVGLLVSAIDRAIRPGSLEMINVEHLRKQYGDATAVDDVTFAAEPGRIFGLLGPNGAGKSTTIGCISGLLKPTSGRITVLGHDVVTDSIESRRELGIVPQELALYEELGARENLAYWGAAYGMSGDALKRRVLEVLETIGLGDRAIEPVKRYSGGMKRRLNFGCGIVHRPRVLLLDEPTVGVDPQSRVRLLDLVRQQAARRHVRAVHDALHGRSSGPLRSSRHHRPR